jgi:hypothetical protein
MIKVRVRVLAHKSTALKAAPSILNKNLKGGLQAVGKRLQTSARTRMRKDTGSEQKNLKIEVSGNNLSLNVAVFAVLVQAFVDAYGMKRGVFPPYREGSNLYNWAKRRLRGIPVKPVRTIGTPQGPRAIRRKIPRVRKVRRINRGPAEPLTTTARSRAKNTSTKRLAFLVARAIWRRGRSGTKWHTMTMDANRVRIVREMSNALTRAVNEIKRK